MVAAIGLAGCGSGGAGGATRANDKRGAQPAQVLKVSPRTLTLTKSYPTLLRSPQQVKVVARVGGFLEKRYYTEGSYVKKGQKLFTVEPAPYKAQVKQRKANLASAKAKEHKAALDWKRMSTLYARHATSRQQRDNAHANLEMARAAEQQARAALDQARIKLGYTQVTAPVAGMASLSKVNVGDLVQASQALATITPLDPVEARFSMSVKDTTALRLQRRSGGGPRVDAVLRSSGGRILTGKVNFLGSKVNTQTGTVQARAAFHNPQGEFLPGEFVRVELRHLRLPHVLAVPQMAVTEGQEGPELYVLGKHNKAQPRNVDLGAQTPKHWVIVKSGIKAGDRVVVNHLAQIHAGLKVKPQAFKGGPGVAITHNDPAYGDAKGNHAGAGSD